MTNRRRRGLVSFSFLDGGNKPIYLLFLLFHSFLHFTPPNCRLGIETETGIQSFFGRCILFMLSYYIPSFWFFFFFFFHSGSVLFDGLHDGFLGFWVLKEGVCVEEGWRAFWGEGSCAWRRNDLEKSVEVRAGTFGPRFTLLFHALARSQARSFRLPQLVVLYLLICFQLCSSISLIIKFCFLWVFIFFRFHCGSLDCGGFFPPFHSLNFKLKYCEVGEGEG